MPSPAYPAINLAGVRFQFPIQGEADFRTVSNNMPTGKRYAYYWRGTVLRRWTLKYSVLNADELAVLEEFFAEMEGRLGAFAFTDNEGVLRASCRFDMDDLAAEYVGPGQYSVTVVIVELPV